ncbi:MAG: rod-binding protein [Syntrophobacteraceae bacterium]
MRERKDVMETGLKPIMQADSSRELELQKKRLRENCREFESVMVSYLMKTMRESVMRAEEPENAREMYEDMLAGQMSKEMAKSGAIGMGDMLYSRLEHLLKTQPHGPEGGSSDQPREEIVIQLQKENSPAK